MLTYQVNTGTIEGEAFKPDEPPHSLEAGGDAEATQKMWALAKGAPSFSSATHIRLREETGALKRRLVGIWPVFEAGA